MKISNPSFPLQICLRTSQYILRNNLIEQPIKDLICRLIFMSKSNKKDLPLSIIIIILFFSLNSKAQITIGLKGGYTNTWPGFGDVELPENAVTDISSFNLSILVEKEIGKGLAFNFGPGYIKRGAACFPGWQPVFEGDSKVYLDYIEFPFSIVKNLYLDKLKLNVVPGIGFGVSYLYSAASHQELIGQTDLLISVSDISIGEESSDSFNRYDSGFYYSLRLEKGLFSHHSIFIESVYYRGIKDYDKVNVSKNRNLNINFGFAYILTK